VEQEQVQDEEHGQDSEPGALAVVPQQLADQDVLLNLVSFLELLLPASR
jgi:hypothetical protein